MNLTQSIDELWTSLVASMRTAQVCLSGASGAADCSMAWKILAVVASILIVAVTYSVIRYFVRYLVAIKQLKAEQVVASEEEMNKVRWQPGETQAEAQSQQVLAAQIKEALRQKKESSG